MKIQTIEGNVYTQDLPDLPADIVIPDWANWIAQEDDGVYCAFASEPLFKLPWMFWKAQGPEPMEGENEFWQGEPFEMDYDDPRRLWRVER